MTKQKILLKAKKGRIARVSPDGEFIPEDQFIKVTLTNYVRRLIEVHEDVIVKDEQKTTNPTASAQTKSTKKEDK